MRRNLTVLVYFYNTLRQEIFVEEILAEDTFAEFIFAILPQSRKIKFREYLLLGTNRENKFQKNPFFQIVKINRI